MIRIFQLHNMSHGKKKKTIFIGMYFTFFIIIMMEYWKIKMNTIMSKTNGSYDRIPFHLLKVFVIDGCRGFFSFLLERLIEAE